jgi:hypothetical protein
MSLLRIVLAAALTLWLVAPGVALSPTPSASGISQTRASDAGNRGGGTKQRQPRRSETAEPQTYDPTTDAAEEARLTRILNICRGC